MWSSLFFLVYYFSISDFFFFIFLNLFSFYLSYFLHFFCLSYSSRHFLVISTFIYFFVHFSVLLHLYNIIHVLFPHTLFSYFIFLSFSSVRLYFSFIHVLSISLLIPVFYTSSSVFPLSFLLELAASCLPAFSSYVLCITSFLLLFPLFFNLFRISFVFLSM